MLYRWLLWVKDPKNSLWIVPSLGAFFAIIAAMAATLSDDWLTPESLPDINKQTVASMLNVIASSMLAVTTFSLSIMVSAFASTANNATPRATNIVMSDDNTRMAIASFLSAFVYAMMAKIILDVGWYQQSGRFVLFICTIAVFIYLIAVIIRWVGTLALLGRIDDTLDKIEAATMNTLTAHNTNPMMGAKAIEKIPNGYSVSTDKTGYLTHIDMRTLNKLAEEFTVQIYIHHRPGTFLVNGQTLVTVTGLSKQDTFIGDDSINGSIKSTFFQSDNRSFEQDPHYGFIVLAEVAQRALSPGVNDAGTAIKVMSLMTKILIDAEKSGSSPKDKEDHSLQYSELYLQPLEQSDFIHHGFDMIARESGESLEVYLQQIQFLSIIHRHINDTDIANACKAQAKRSCQRGREKLRNNSDLEELNECYQHYFVDDLMFHMAESSIDLRKP